MAIGWEEVKTRYLPIRQPMGTTSGGSLPAGAELEISMAIPPDALYASVKYSNGKSKTWALPLGKIAAGFVEEIKP